MEGKVFWSFFFGGGGKEVMHCIFGHDFLSPRTIVLGIKNYPSPSISCCSDDLAQFTTVLRPLKSEVQKHISPKITFCL